MQTETIGSTVYQEQAGFWFQEGTPQEVRSAILQAHRLGGRVRVFYGSQETGEAWPEENDVSGCIGRSTGRVKVPLIVAPGASGGDAMLAHRVVALRSDAGWLYRHPKFDPGTWGAMPGDIPGYAEVAMHNGSVHARFKKAGAAERYCQFMRGERLTRMGAR